MVLFWETVCSFLSIKCRTISLSLPSMTKVRWKEFWLPQGKMRILEGHELAMFCSKDDSCHRWEIILAPWNISRDHVGNSHQISHKSAKAYSSASAKIRTTRMNIQYDSCAFLYWNLWPGFKIPVSKTSGFCQDLGTQRSQAAGALPPRLWWHSAGVWAEI